MLVEDDATDAARVQPGRPDLFVSYAREDLSFVRRLTDALESRGKHVWVDWDAIRKGADWRERIHFGIESAKAVVAVLSTDFAESEVCDEEVAHAVSQNKRLLPIVRFDVTPARLRDELRRPNWIFCREEDDFDAAVVELVEALDTDIEWLDDHARLLVRAREWEAERRDASFLLRGRDLHAAESWLADTAAHAESPTALQTAYILASRRGANRRQRIAFAAVLAALAVTAALGILALLQRNNAIANEHRARSREIATLAQTRLRSNPELALLLAIESAELSPTEQARKALVQALAGTGEPQVLRGSDILAYAEFSPDGRRLAAAASNGPVRVWNVRTGAQIAIVGRADDELSRTVTFSADGQRLVVTATGSPPIVLTPSGRRVAVLRGRGDWDQAIFTRDRRFIVAADDFGIVGIWSNDGRQRKILNLPLGNSSLIDIAVDPSGQTLATVTIDGKIRLWRIPSGSPIRTLPTKVTHDSDKEAALAFSPTGRLLATGGQDGAVGLWRVPDGRQVTAIKRHKGSVWSVAFNSDGRLLVSAGSDKTVRLWNTAGLDAGTQSGAGPSLLVIHQTAAIGKAVFSPDGLLAATLDSKGAARVWSLAEGARIAAVTEPPGSAFRTKLLTGIAFSPDSRLLATPTLNGNVLLWRVRDAQPPMRFAGTTRFAAVAISADGRRVLTAATDAPAALQELTTPGRAIALARVGGAGITSVALSDDGAFALTSGSDGNVRAWSDSGQLIATIRDRAGRAAAISSTGRLAVTKHDDGRVRLLRIEERVQPAAIHTNTSFPLVVMSADGTRVVATSRDGQASLWAASSGKRLARFGTSGQVAVQLAISRDGATVATAFGDGTVRLWEATNGQPGPTLPAQGATVSSMDFHPNGTVLAAADDNTVQLWNVASGAQIDALRANVGRIVITRFSPDGRYLLTAGFHGTTTVWDLETGEPLHNFRGANGASTVRDVRLGEVFDARKANGLLTGAWFSNDGETVLTATLEGIVHLYRCELCVPTKDLVAIARQSASRELTTVERQTYVGAR